MAGDADFGHQTRGSIFLGDTQQIELIVPPSWFDLAFFELLGDAVEHGQAFSFGVDEVVHLLAQSGGIQAFLESQRIAGLDKGDLDVALGVILEVHAPFGQVESVRSFGRIAIERQQCFECVGNVVIDVAYLGEDLI